MALEEDVLSLDSVATGAVEKDLAATAARTQEDVLVRQAASPETTMPPGPESTDTEGRPLAKPRL
jgi:hypothetical protein